MNNIFRCKCCRTSYELCWDDNIDAYYSGVEDTDDDMTDFDSNVDPEYCPFCGSHSSYDPEC